MAKVLTLVVLLFILVVCSAPKVCAQTTEFTYQGNLKDGTNPANGNYDFEFLLFDAVTSGTQQGSTLTKTNVAVANGTFSVKLDFGSQFPGANRFLEIHVRTAGGGAFTTLTPRQSVGSSPYAVQSLNALTATTAVNATQLGGIPVNGFILNTTSPQATSNLNISGNGVFGNHVGIGTPSSTAILGVAGAPPPAAPVGNGVNAETVLQVVGPMGGASDNQAISVGGNGSSISITAGDGGRNPAFPANDGTGGSITLQPGLARAPAQNGNILLAPTGGNVGIGIGSPLSRLSVAAASPGAAVSVTNSQAGISNPSPANLPPAALKGEQPPPAIPTSA